VSRLRYAAAAWALAAAAILVLLLFVPWYTVNEQAYGITANPSLTFNLYLGSSVKLATSCTNGEVCHTPSSQSLTYSNLGWNQTGELFSALRYVVVAAIAAAALGAGLIIARGGKPPVARTVVLGLLAGAAALVLTSLLASVAIQPITMHNDGIPYNSMTGPTFVGSCGPGASANCSAYVQGVGVAAWLGGPVTWAPNVGWYIGFIALGMAIVALILARRVDKTP
jgi:hypothetical protein